VTVSKARKTKIVGCIGLLVVAALGWVVAIGPRTSALADARQQADETRIQIDALRAQINVLRRQEAGLGAIRKTAAALAAKFPATAEQPRMFQEVTEAAVAAGIPETKVTAVTPQAPVAGGPGQAAGAKLPGQSRTAGLARQTVTMSVEGKLDQLQQLMRNLEQMPRAYLVTTVAVAQGSEGGLYTATITGDMFVMPAAPDPARAAPARPAKPGRTVASTPSSGAARTGPTAPR